MSLPPLRKRVAGVVVGDDMKTLNPMGVTRVDYAAPPAESAGPLGTLAYFDLDRFEPECLPTIPLELQALLQQAGPVHGLSGSDHSSAASASTKPRAVSSGFQRQAGPRRASRACHISNQ